MSGVRYITHAPELGPKEWTTITGPSVELPPPPYDPTVLELAQNFGAAMARVAIAGITGQRVRVTEAEYRVRVAACEPCPYWDAAGWGGLGRCNAPGCSCTHFKRWLATEACKHPAGSRWPSVPPLKGLSFGEA